jgi:chromosome segregation ATPase
MQSEKNKLDDKLDAVAKEKLDLEGKLSKLSAQLTDTIKNLNEMSTKYVMWKCKLKVFVMDDGLQEAERQKLKGKIKFSQDQLSAKHDEVSKLQVRLSSQTSALSTIDTKLKEPASPSISASPLMNSAPKNAVSQKGVEEMKRVSVLKIPTFFAVYTYKFYF